MTIFTKPPVFEDQSMLICQQGFSTHRATINNTRKLTGQIMKKVDTDGNATLEDTKSLDDMM